MMLTKIKSLSNTWHFYAILVALIGLSLISLWYTIVLIIYLIYLYRIKFINKEIIILSLYIIISLLFLSLYNVVSDKKEIAGVVISITKHDDYCSIVVLKGLRKLRVISGVNIIPQIGDRIKLEGSFKKLGFDSFSMYLKGNGIFSSFSASKLEVEGKSIFSFKGKIIEFYQSHLDEKAFTYFKSLILGINDFDIEYKEAINSIGISYLFCISGFHISMIALIFDKLLKKIFPLSYKRDYIVIILLFSYVILTNFSYGVLRAVLMYTLTKLNLYKRLGMPKLDICSFSFIIIVILNPMSLYSMSLRLSYIMVLMIILSEDLLKNKEGLTKSYLMALIAFLVTIPLVITINHEINLITLIISPIFLALFSFLILPITYIMIILPVLSPFMSSVYTLFEDIVYFFNSIELLKISIRNLRAYEIILYYFIYYLVLKYFENHGVSYFKLMLMLLVILLMDGFDYIIIYDQVIMLDVG